MRYVIGNFKFSLIKLLLAAQGTFLVYYFSISFAYACDYLQKKNKTMQCNNNTEEIPENIQAF